MGASASSPGPNKVTVTGDNGQSITSATVDPSTGVVVAISNDTLTCNITNLASGSTYTITVVINNVEYVYSVSVAADGTVTFN